MCIMALVAHGREVLGRQRLSEEVGPVVSRLDEGDRDALLLDQLADEDVSSRDVLSLGVELGVVGWLSIASAVRARSV